MNRGDKLEGQIRAVLAAEASTRRLVSVRTQPAVGARLLWGAFAAAFILVLALGLGQGVRGLRERAAATQSPDAVGSVGASSLVPPHLASPDSIVALSESNRGRPAGAPTNDARVQVIDSQTGAIRYTVPVADQAQAVFRAAGGELIVIDWPSDNEQRIQFLDARTGAVKSTLSEQQPRPLTPTLGQWPELGAAVSPDGKLLALQRLGSRSVAPPNDQLAFYDLELRKMVDSLATPGCGVGEIGFTDDGHHLFLACSASLEVLIADAGTRKQIARSGVPLRRIATNPGLAGMAVVGSSATLLSADGQERTVIRVDGTASGVNLGQMFVDAIVPPGAIARVPRQARVFVGYGPSTPGNVVNDARIMDEGSSGGRFSITHSSIGGILADDRGELFGADTDGSIWRRGSTTISDDVTLVRAMPGRSVRLLSTVRVSAPTLLSRDQAIAFVNAPNIRIDRIDRVETKLATLGEAMATRGAGPVVIEGVDPATPVWAIALRGEMHNIRGLIDLGAISAIFVIDAQTGEPVAFLPTPADWPNGFDGLIDRGPAGTSPTTSPRVPVIGGTAPIGDISARSACGGNLSGARLVAAFESTAGAVADWVENVSYPDAPHVTSSAWRALAPTSPAYVCYFDGQFASPGGPAPGGSPPPLVGRALLLIDSSGTQLGPSKYGPSDSMPLARPGGRF